MSLHQRITPTVAQQREQQARLDCLRLLRPLTAAEQAEANRLTHAEYMRQYRADRMARDPFFDARLGRPIRGEASCHT